MICLQVAGLCAQYAQAIGQSGGTGLLAEVIRVSFMENRTNIPSISLWKISVIEIGNDLFGR